MKNKIAFYPQYQNVVSKNQLKKFQTRYNELEEAKNLVEQEIKP